MTDLDRCNREQEAMAEQHDAPAWLVTLGMEDWEREKQLVRTDEYEQFLRAKRIAAPSVGIEPRTVNSKLFPFQSDIVRWALKKGRAAIFADCGLGKSPMQLEWARQVADDTAGRVLILAPLAVSSQTVLEGEKFGIAVNKCRNADGLRSGINITNYEMLQHFDPSAFSGIVLDESSILKSYDGSTRKQITEFAGCIPYRLAATATPSPNDHTELGTHAEFLGVMSRTEMLATFFVHDGGDTSKWRLKGHAETAFWKWLASWAVMIRKPSDLGYSDDGFALPPLEIHEQVVKVQWSNDVLFPVEAKTLAERRDARRNSLNERVAKCADLVNANDAQWLVWCDLNAESEALAKACGGAVEVRGSDSQEHKEKSMLDFAAGRIRVLVSKPSICGFGMNFQACHHIACVGLSDSWESYYQAVRRCWRFGQRHPVECHIITSEAEGAVVANIKRKESQAAEMAESMAEHMRDITQSELHSATVRQTDEYRTGIERGQNWTAHLGDCVEVMRAMADESIDYFVFSPPFNSLYTYSNSERDMGNSRSDEQFEKHYLYLIREQFRVLRPGRLLSFHCMNLPTSKERDGVIGLRDFRGDLIRWHQSAGFIYHSEAVIWKDPVTAMQRTKALGLLHKTIRKDSSMSRQGIPDYLVTMRKPGENPKPISHTSDEYPVSKWQKIASPIWMDINPSDTLQRESAREEKDERHIAPLQLEVIRRALELWSARGDLVCSPFMGIGSEGVVSLELGRRFVGIELKQSYFRQAVVNLRNTENSPKEQPSMFNEEFWP